MTNIHTKWHKLKGCVDAGEVHWTAVKGQLCHPWERHASIKVEKLNGFFDSFRDLPKFVIDPELLNLTHDEDYHRSLMDMKRADVLRLPFPACIVELESGNAHGFILLHDLQGGGIMPFEDRNVLALTEQAPFYAMVWLLNKDENGEYITMSPSVLQLDITEGNDEEVFYLKIGGFSNSLTNEGKDTNDLCKDTFQKDAGWAYHALFAALLLTNTKGVKREIIECERLNHKRAASGKPPIPRHTYITIGRVYHSASGEAADDYVPRKSPRPHWRRGHLRNVRIGEGRTGTKAVFIEGRLVSRPGDAEVPAPTYHVKP